MRRTFAEAFPEVAKTWSDRNLPLTPDQVSYGSSKKAWWKGECGHEWQTAIKYRGKGHGCPYCSGNAVLKGENDLETLYPDVAIDWSEKNYPLKADMVTSHGSRIVWWKCHHCGYEWKAKVADRTIGSGCPCCAGHVVGAGINDLGTFFPELIPEWSDRNTKPISEYSPKSFERVWWHCLTCGHEWQVSIHRRVIGAGQCPECVAHMRVDALNEKQLMKVFERNRLEYHLRYLFREYGEVVHYDDDSVMGLPLPIYLPKRRCAITVDTYKRQIPNSLHEHIKIDMCKKKGIVPIYMVKVKKKAYEQAACIVLNKDTWKCEREAVTTLFQMFGFHPDQASKYDKKDIFQFYKKSLNIQSL